MNHTNKCFSDNLWKILSDVFFFFKGGKVGGNTPILRWPVRWGQEQGRERSWHLFCCGAGNGFVLRVAAWQEDRENLVSWQNFRKKITSLFFVTVPRWPLCSGTIKPSWTSVVGFQLMEWGWLHQLVTPGLLQSPQGEMGTSKGVICLILKLSKPILHELWSRYPQVSLLNQLAHSVFLTPKRNVTSIINLYCNYSNLLLAFPYGQKKTVGHHILNNKALCTRNCYHVPVSSTWNKWFFSSTFPCRTSFFISYHFHWFDWTFSSLPSTFNIFYNDSLTQAK